MLVGLSPAMEQMRKNDIKKYYSDVLPTLYAEHLMEKTHESFVVLIIDEAQDVFETHYIYCSGVDKKYDEENELAEIQVIQTHIFFSYFAVTNGNVVIFLVFLCSIY